MTESTSKVDTIGIKFAADGFAVAEELADADCLAALRPIYDAFLDGTIRCPTTDRKLGGLTTHIINPHLYSSQIRDNTAVENARKIARALQNTDEPELVFSAIFYKPGGHPHITPWHQDMSYAGRPTFPTGAKIPNNTVTTFWLAIDDVAEDMGCMEFIPGLQNDPMPEHFVASGKPMAEDRLLAIVDAEQRLPIERAVKCPLKAGSATIHGYGTPHYTGPNHSARGRKALVFSFNHPDTVKVVGAALAAHP